MSRRALVVGEIVGALSLVALSHGLFARFGLRERMLEYLRGSPEYVNEGEGLYFVIQLGCGIAASVLLADALSRALHRRSLLAAVEAKPKALAAMSAVFAALAAVVVAKTALRFTELTDDELIYQFQAKCYLAGGTTTVAPSPRSAFAHQYAVFVGGDRYGGLFPPGQPLLLTLGVALGHPGVTQYLCAAAIVWTTARFADEEWGARASIVTAALLATSPALIFTAATLHSAVPSAMCAAIAVRHAARLSRGEPSWNGLWVGGAAGFGLLCRPLDGALIALWAALFLAVTRRRSAVRPLILAACAGLPFFVAQLLVYRSLSGSLFKTPYAVWIEREYPGARLFGFGTTVWNFEHTPRVAVDKTIAAATRVSMWAFGWPLSLAALVPAALGYASGRAARAVLVLMLFNATGYFFYAFGSTHDLGSYYHLFSVPLLAAITARVLTEAEGKHPRWMLLAAAASVFGAATFVPQQMARLRLRTGIIRASSAVAERTEGRLLIFYDRVAVWASSWEFSKPLPSPRHESDRVMWVHAADRELMLPVAAEHRDRKPYVLKWDGDRPYLAPLQP